MGNRQSMQSTQGQGIQECLHQRQQQQLGQGEGSSACTASPKTPWLQPRWTNANTAAARRCLANRSLWVLGNSVARHWAFALSAILLEGITHPLQMSSTSREMEKERCGRGGAWGGQKVNNASSRRPVVQKICHGACACDFDVRSRLGPHAALMFKWNFHLDSDMLAPAIAPPDIMIYSAFRNHRSATVAAQVTHALKAKPSFRFYWLATTALCSSNRAARADQNEQLCNLNHRIERQLCAPATAGHAGPEQAPVRLLDGFGWTLGRCDQYDDNIHHSRLAFDHVTTFLRHECHL